MSSSLRLQLRVARAVFEWSETSGCIKCGKTWEYVYLGIRTIYHSSFEVGKLAGIKHKTTTLEVGEIRVIWEIAICKE